MENKKCTEIVLFILLQWIGEAFGGYRRDAFQKVQKMDYPCREKSLWKSDVPPNSVHRLRPGDINVIGAVGDSLTVGNGALTDNLYDVFFRQNRGVSWSIGGQGNWSQFLTVPNLLKVMNPDLVGYSTGDGHLYSNPAQFNAAYSGAMDQDLLEQAIWLVREMKLDPRVDFRNHWKLITLMIGTNDICSDQCYNVDEGTETHRRNIIRVLDFFYENLPKTFINLVSMPYVPFYADLTDPPFATCITMKLLMCSCLFGGGAPETKLLNAINATREFQRVEMEIAASDRYAGREDFTVVYQPTHLNSKFPRLKNPGKRSDPHDYSYVAIDCIHYTQKLHAVLANIYWNNLFQDPGRKTSTWNVPAYAEILCPKKHKPYLVTGKNYKSNLM